MKICVIGGSGFIGGYLINDLLFQNYDVYNIDKSPSRRHSDITRLANIQNAKKLEDTLDRADWLLLLAAEHADDVTPVSLYYDVNVTGTRNVIDAAEEKGINKILFTSTVAVYGLNKDNPSEHSPKDPFNHYGRSKHQAEEILLQWYQEKPAERTLVIIRPTVVFGPGNRGNVFKLLRQIAANKFLMIGDGNNKKSMSYVENVAGFISHCVSLNLSGYHLFNYVDKPDLTTNELVRQAEVTLGKKILPFRVSYFVGLLGGYCFDLLSKITRRKYSISSIRVKKFCATTQFTSVHCSKIGYQPKFSLQKGLELTIKSIADEGKSRLQYSRPSAADDQQL